MRRRRNRGAPPVGGVGGPGGGPATPAGASGGGGNNASGGGSGSSVSRAQRVSGSGASQFPDSDTMGSLTPGVMLIGEGSKAEMIERAKKQGLDVLALFQIRVTGGRNTTCTTGLRFINVHTGEDIAKGKTLKTDDVEDARERSRDRRLDPVEAALDSVFKVGDEQIKASSLPAALKPEHVENRLRDVIAREYADKLAITVEIISFNRKGLLDDEKSRNALDNLLGEGVGQKLMTGTIDERAAALSSMLPGKVKVGSGGSGGSGAVDDPF